MACTAGIKVEGVDRLRASIQTLVSGLTYDGGVPFSNSCSVTKDGAPGCCNSNPQNSQCVANCPVMGYGSSTGISDSPNGGGPVDTNNSLFPPTPNCFATSQDASKKEVAADSDMDCLKAGNCWLQGKCYAPSTAQTLDPTKAVDTTPSFCHSPDILKGLSMDATMPPGLVDIAYPATNNPATSISTLNLWLFYGLGLDAALQTTAGDVKTYKDLGAYLLTTLPMGQSSGYGLIPYIDDSAWWALTRLQALHALMAQKSTDGALILSLFQQLLGSAMFFANAADDVCGPSIPWQCTKYSDNNSTKDKAAITNLLFVGISVGACNFYTQHLAFLQKQKGFDTTIDGGLAGQLTPAACIQNLHAVAVQIFGWVLSPVGDASAAGGIFTTNPAGTYGEIYDGLKQVNDCSSLGCWNLSVAYPTSQGWDPSMAKCTATTCSGTPYGDWCKGKGLLAGSAQKGTVQWKCAVPYGSGAPNFTAGSGTDDGPTTYNQGMFVFAATQLAFGLQNGVFKPTEFPAKYFDTSGRLVQLSTMSSTDAAAAVIGLAEAAADFMTENLTVKAADGSVLITDADLNGMPCNGSSGGGSESDKVLFRGLAAYGLAALCNSSLTSADGRAKYAKLVQATADYTWNNIRNPLSNCLGTCYYRDSSSIKTTRGSLQTASFDSGGVAPSAAEDCGLGIYFSTKGTASGLLAMTSSTVVGDATKPPQYASLFGFGTAVPPTPKPPPPKPPPPPPPTPTPKPSEGLSGSAIAGIVIGCVAFLVILISFIFYMK